MGKVGSQIMTGAEEYRCRSRCGRELADHLPYRKAEAIDSTDPSE